MPQIPVPDGAQARAIHIRQIVNWLRGDAQYSEAVFFSGYTSASAYALTVANRGVGGLALAVKTVTEIVRFLRSRRPESLSDLRPV
jgi:hypothetical protein